MIDLQFKSVTWIRLIHIAKQKRSIDLACGLFLKALINASVAAKCVCTYAVSECVCLNDRPNYVNMRAL